MNKNVFKLLVVLHSFFCLVFVILALAEGDFVMKHPVPFWKGLFVIVANLSGAICFGTLIPITAMLPNMLSEVADANLSTKEFIKQIPKVYRVVVVISGFFSLLTSPYHLYLLIQHALTGKY